MYKIKRAKPKQLNEKPNWVSSDLSLVEAGILNGAVRFVERLEGVAHVPVPHSGVFVIRDAEQLPHFFLYHICSNDVKYINIYVQHGYTSSQT